MYSQSQHIDTNPYRQESLQHSNTYSSQTKRPMNQSNAPWQSQFQNNQYENYQTYQQSHQQIKPTKHKHDVANFRVNNRSTQNAHLYKNREHQYIPRSQSMNNEIFDRRIQNPGETVDRNYGVERSFGIDSHHISDSANELASFYGNNNSIGMQQQHDFIDDRSQTYTFKNKRDDLNDRLNAQDRRTTSVNGAMPIHEFNPYLDMRPQNTSDLYNTQLST